LINQCSFVLELAENVVENTSVLVVSNLGVGIETASYGELLATVGGDGYILADPEGTALKINVELLGTIQAETVSGLAFLKLERKNAHADEVTAVNTLVALGNDSLNTLEVGALGSPVTGGTGTVLFSSHDDGVDARLLVLVGCVEDGHFLAGGDVLGDGSSLLNHFVDNADVGEGSTSHDLVITTAGTIRVKVFLGDAAFSEVNGSGRVLSDLTGGGDVIGGDGVTKVEEAVGRGDVLDGVQGVGSVLEERRVVDIGGGIIPFV
jgi:hypothetical protein